MFESVNEIVEEGDRRNGLAEAGEDELEPPSDMSVSF